MPHRMFWIAIASPNTSRSQPLARDCGVKNNPSVARGPKLSIEMRQPHSTITTGVRQPIVAPRELDGSEMAMAPVSEGVPPLGNGEKGGRDGSRKPAPARIAFSSGRADAIPRRVSFYGVVDAPPNES